VRAMIPILGLAILISPFTACEREDDADEEETTMPHTQIVIAPAWADTLAAYLPALGHRNWIVVADSAFPLQISPGIETIVTNEDHFAVLEKALKTVDAAKHIRPKIWLDKELGFVTEDLAPGADDVRRRLAEALKGRGAAPVLHEELIARLDQAGKAFKIVMVKTTLAVPYTSVFLELDCGYWPSENEARIREKMK
jgi:L-fucose mutarotase/ribose pyranase (RbsD/FucU family)